MSEDKTQRAQRLSAALRANLVRRKQEARQRASGERPKPSQPEPSDMKKPDTDRSTGKA